jgi:hypothetical protein
MQDTDAAVHLSASNDTGSLADGECGCLGESAGCTILARVHAFVTRVSLSSSADNSNT